jgi:hypothetical protein
VSMYVLYCDYCCSLVGAVYGLDGSVRYAVIVDDDRRRCRCRSDSVVDGCILKKKEQAHDSSGTSPI